MKSENKVLSIIKEEVQIFETKLNSHAIQRLNERLDMLTKSGDLTQREIGIIKKNLNNILSHDFNPNESYGIFLGSFVPNPKSNLFTNTNSHNPGIPFYEIYGVGNDELMKDSTGDEFWAVVRKNVITTVMLRKRLQREFAHNERNDRGGLGVNNVITNFDNYLQKSNSEKQQREPEKQQEKLININGVLWIIDDVNERIYKKNNQNTFITFDNVLDYPDWDDKTKEQILNILVGQDNQKVQQQKTQNE